MRDITRRRFLDRAGTYAVGGLAAAAIVKSRTPAEAGTQQAPQGATPQNWLGLTEEAALEPRLPIIDPHHHLWDRPGNRYVLEEHLVWLGQCHSGEVDANHRPNATAPCHDWGLTPIVTGGS